MGKTEAALLWLGNHKGFFVLPLRTAINAMYKRIETEIIRGKKEESLALLHSDTMSIKRRVRHIISCPARAIMMTTVWSVLSKPGTDVYKRQA